MRIISGRARGVRLGAVPPGVRPTSDRVRESVFNSLGQFFRGGIALDLYAGTGALGIEALSRGVERAIFVERDRVAAASIRENLKRTRLTESAEIFSGEAKEMVERLAASGKQFNLIFADPPYRIAAAEAGWLAPLLPALLAEGGAAVIESDAPVEVEGLGVAGLDVRTRRYGQTHVSFLEVLEDREK